MREGNKLTATEVSKKRKPGRYSDGHGLWLQVAEGGSKAWLFRYMLNGRARHMGLGPLHTVSLAEARLRARHARQLLLDGKDPLVVKHAERLASRLPVNMPFKEAAEKFIEIHNPTWTNARHRQQWRNTLRDYVSRELDRLPVAAIDGAAINETLAPIWQSKRETARRVKQRIERVCQWVKDGMPPPNGGALQSVQHFAALPFAEIPIFMADLRAIDSIAARALEFAILTAARTDEARAAKWSEIYLKQKIWTVPPGRIKKRREHIVPLSPDAVKLLESLHRDHSDWVFLGTKPGKPISHDAMRKVLGQLRPGLTVHGFRSSFRDWAGDQTHFATEVINFALAHSIPDKTSAAYRRYTALEKRRKLMEAWAQYCSALVGGKVVALHA
jgi:integrase